MIECEVCNREFRSDDMYQFICDKCQVALLPCFDCGSPDVTIDWHIMPPDMIMVWRAECNLCDCHFEGDETAAKKVYSDWQGKAR